MHLMYFTEQPMSTYPTKAVGDDGITALMFPNSNFNSVDGSRLYNERLEEYLLAEDVGFDGIMLNEHHDAPFCMQAQIVVWSSILAAATKRVKIVQLGVPLPTLDNPVAMAESLAMIDMISKGRLVSGIVRGAGTEQYANNSNPAFNRERFIEGHDLLIKAWTEPGPWRWEGNHYNFRVVNPWALPLQKPHPRIWVPGVASLETIIWCAQRRYPYICLNTTIEQTKTIWELYNKTAEESGYTAGPEHRGYLLRVHVADTEEKALANGREFMWMQGEFTGLAHPVWAAPTGYSSPTSRRAVVERQNKRGDQAGAMPYEEQLDNLQIIAGTPDQVIKKLRYLMSETRPGIFALWGNDGRVNHEDSKRCIELMGSEVLPALRDIADELDLRDPFEVNAPLSDKFLEAPTIG